jgi:DNA-binding beta-propeller fold protein YncE
MLTPGTTVAGYRIEALIGRGGMGAVYRAEEEGLGRKVALKVIAPELASDERFRERFLRESRIAASLDHPHVIPIYQAGDVDGLLFLAMRYVEGYDLAKLIAEHGALDPKRTVDLLSQIAEALDAAHEKGLVHRDIKPSNVLIAEAAGKEHCYLGDFGLTKRTGSLSGVSVAGEIVGTLEYVAPEQITGDALDERADVYSLGCVLYECLTGQSPFPRATDVALLWAHVHEEPTPPSQARPELPKELDTVLARALAKEPGRRYRSAGELMAATRSALRLGDALPAAPTRPRWLVPAVAAALLAGVAVIAALVFGGGSSGLSGVLPNSVGVIDSASAKLVDDVQVGIDPQAIAFGAGGVWVANVEDTSITRIDPATHELVRAGIGVPDYPSDVITGAGDAWVALGATAELVRINPQQNQPSEPVSAVGARAGCGAPFASLAYGAGQVWFVCQGGAEFGSYDPRTGVARRLALECQLATFSKSTLPEYADMTFGLDTVWIANSAGNQVVGVDPVICQDPDQVSAGSGPIAIAVGGNSLWVANFDADTVMRIDDPAGGAPVPSTFDVGDGPSDVAVDASGVWVVNKLDRNVMRLDPETGHVEATIELGNEPQRVAVGGGSVWVTVRAPDELESSSTTP